MGRTELPKEPYWDGPLSHPFYSKVVKRILDFLLALILLIPGLVMMIPLAVWVKLDSEGPVLYKAVRGGYHNQPFLIFKFRSMVVDADKTGGCTAKNDSRVTRAGRIMRRLKLDELPQLFNILKGDMSVVGPRPLLMRYLPRYNARQARRNEVRPGFTGLAQVNGRNAITWEEKFEWDVRYVDSVSFLGDWSIILQTVKTVLSHEGISSGTSVTMEEFMGTPEPEKTD